MIGRKDVRCPHCLERFPVSELAFRCPGPLEAHAGPGPDDAARDPRVFSPPPQIAPWLRNVRVATCSCGRVTRVRACPRCGAGWPAQLEESVSLIIAVVGASGAGKSHYLAVLLEELSRNGAAHGAVVSAADDETRGRYESDFRQRLYRNHTVIPKTTERHPSPLLFRMTFADGPRFLGALRVVTLVFFDSPGESFQTEQTMSRDAAYLGSADALLLLVDPLAAAGLSSDLIPPGTAVAAAQDPLDVLARAEQFVRNARGLPPHERVPIPVAVTFTKMDVLRPTLPASSVLRKASTPAGGGTDALARVDATMRSLAVRWLGSGFDEYLRQRFTHSGYFGVSSLGGSADKDGRLPHGISAFRVAEPFLWLLSILRVIEPAHVPSGAILRSIAQSRRTGPWKNES